MSTDRVDRYGHFSEDGREYVVTDPRTPRPWSNVISNERFGLAVSQCGSGFTWIDNSQLAVVNWWQQDFAQDTSGKFLYARDAESGAVWSLSPAPVWADPEAFSCTHGIGYTRFDTFHHEIASRWTLFAHESDTVELWLVRLTNTSGRKRTLELTGSLDWCCGTTPAARREFHKLFIETEFDPSAGAIFGWSRMWDVGSKRWGHWNTDFPYVAAFGTTEPILSAEGDRAEFLGRNGTPRNPAALSRPEWAGRFGRHYDPIGAMRIRVELAAGEEKTIGFAIAVERSRNETATLLRRSLDVASMQDALVSVTQSWIDRLAAHRMETPDRRFDDLVNDWVRYQAISARIWGRAGYYQQSGAYGFRDQLQDSQVWLTIDPQRCRKQIELHAAHQFADGSVYHWWHPLSEQGHITKMTDDLLWLAFVTANYVRETGDYSILDDAAPFLDDASPAPLEEHVRRAFERVFRRTSPRGLPYIGAGDWNDGLSALGLEERGESVWLGHFLAGLLADWSEIHRRTGRAGFASGFEGRRGALVHAINELAWDGAWYRRATRDDGTWIGTHENREGRIYLNAQTWAVLNDVAPRDRAQHCMKSVEEHLAADSGALLLAPAYDTPDETIGYITRYAPGLRENGGVYTHAATWAIAAAAKMKNAPLVSRFLRAIDPTNKDPERYWAEPYVLPGNVDGPDSPLNGRAGWTWYTGSAAWLHRVVAEWVLGVRPEWDGLRIDPCLPPEWNHARMIRPWRGAIYDIRIERADVADEPMLIEPRDGGRHEIVFRVGR